MYFPTGLKDFHQDTLHPGSEKARGPVAAGLQRDRIWEPTSARTFA
jgi:hypothetical protein